MRPETQDPRLGHWVGPKPLDQRPLKFVCTPRIRLEPRPNTQNGKIGWDPKLKSQSTWNLTETCDPRLQMIVEVQVLLLFSDIQHSRPLKLEV